MFSLSGLTASLWGEMHGGLTDKIQHCNVTKLVKFCHILYCDVEAHSPKVVLWFGSSCFERLGLNLSPQSQRKL